MAKEWSTIFTNADRTKMTRAERFAADRKADKMIRNTKSLSLEAMQNINDVNYEIQQMENNKLLEAFEEKKVKSKTAIRKAIKLKKEQEAAAKKENKEAS